MSHKINDEIFDAIKDKHIKACEDCRFADLLEKSNPITDFIGGDWKKELGRKCLDCNSRASSGTLWCDKCQDTGEK